MRGAPFFVFLYAFAADVLRVPSTLLRDVHPPTSGTVLCAVFGSRQMASTSQRGAIARRKYTTPKQVLEHGAYFIKILYDRIAE